MTLASGTHLGPYEILGPIGAGGMGEVYKARDTRLDRIVALKVSKKEFNPRFEQEARAVAALNHPHICTLYDVGPDYLVMEYVDGAQLTGPLPVATAVELACQILDALAAAHKRGVTHRDLKPANIMVTGSGVKVLDFGLATMLPPGSFGGNSSTTLTAEGAIAGTLHYMAPEQLQGREADPRADIFSFGCVLYEMLKGKRAFDGSNAASVIAAVVERPAPSVAEVAPAALDRVLKTCLAKDPDERWQNARDLKRELRWAVEMPSVRAAVFSRPWPGLVAAGLLAVLLAGVSFVHFREKPPSRQVARFSIPPPERAGFGVAEGYGFTPVISPDGDRLVFNARGVDGTAQLWIRSLDAIAPRPLAGTEEGLLPFWSPDGKSIGFFVNGKLKRIDVAGGPAVTLADAPFPRGGTWGAAGVIVFGALYTGPLLKVPASGGASSPVTSSDPEKQLRWPSFLPDGQHFLFAVYTPRQARGSAIRVGSIESPEARNVIDADSGAVYAPDLQVRGSGQGYLLFIRGNTLMAQPFDIRRLVAGTDAVAIADGMGIALVPQFSASSNATLLYANRTLPPRQLTWLDRAGKRLATMGEPDWFWSLDFSPDRNKIATTVLDPEGRYHDIWIYEASHGLRTRLTFDPATNAYARWSPDGATIAFASNRKGHYDLYRKPANGAGIDELLYADGIQKFPDSWSPDGKFLLYETLGNPKTNRDLWILPDPFGKPGTSKPYTFLGEPFNEALGQFSPDGKWIAYQSDESGRFEIYAAPFPGPGGKWQVSTGGGAVARWRSDGKGIFYQAQDDRMMAVDVTAKGSTLEVGEAHALFGPVSAPAYDVSADGQRFLLAVPLAAGPESLTLVQNWMAGLKK